MMVALDFQYWESRLADHGARIANGDSLGHWIAWDALVCETNPNVRELWRLAARNNGKRVAFVDQNNWPAYLLTDLARDTPIYLDGSLPLATIDALLARLGSQGFMRIFVTLERGAAVCTRFHYGRVLGKAPPWPPLGSQRRLAPLRAID